MVTRNVETPNFIESLKHWISNSVNQSGEIDARSCIQPVPGHCRMTSANTTCIFSIAMWSNSPLPSTPCIDPSGVYTQQLSSR